jgi:hypothetical protein
VGEGLGLRSGVSVAVGGVVGVRLGISVAVTVAVGVGSVFGSRVPMWNGALKGRVGVTAGVVAQEERRMKDER